MKTIWKPGAVPKGKFRIGDTAWYLNMAKRCGESAIVIGLEARPSEGGGWIEAELDLTDGDGDRDFSENCLWSSKEEAEKHFDEF